MKNNFSNLIILFLLILIKNTQTTKLELIVYYYRLNLHSKVTLTKIRTFFYPPIET